MIIKEITLFGFKSFPTKTQIKLQEGITAFVGPNGCGKTNILDGIRWVLGEQNLKKLRCTRNEELIFTQNEKTIGFGEVKLLFDNDNTIPELPQEIEIRRRFYRSGESKFWINGIECKLKEIEDLLERAGKGNRVYSIFDKETLIEIINGKLHLLLESTAGIHLFQEKKKEAERKLNATLHDLQRLEDIMKEKERIIRSLYKHKLKTEKAHKLRKMLNFLKIKEIEEKLKLKEEKLASYQAKLANISEEEIKLSDISKKHSLKFSSLVDAHNEEEKRWKEFITKIREKEETIKRLSRIEANKDILHQESENTSRELIQLEKDIEKIEEKLKELSEKKEALKHTVLRKENEALKAELALDNKWRELEKSTEKEVVEIGKSIQLQEKTFKEIFKKLYEEKIKLSKLECSFESKKEIFNLLESQRKTLKYKKEEKEETIKNLITDIEQTRNLLRKIEEELELLKISRLPRPLEIKEMLEEKRKIEERMGKLRKDRKEIESIYTQLKIEIELLKRERENYTIYDATPSETSLTPEEIEAELQRLGPINEAIYEQYEEEKNIFEEFKKQHKDIKSAAAKLSQMVKEIDIEAKRRYIETFEKIREEYKKLFPHFFRGGTGDLILTDYQNPLEAEIQILANPEGKKLKRLQQLSEGEKTLLGITLLFSLYSINPSKFLFIDELDAPLDEANTIKFVEYLKKLSQDIQIIIVTHNKRTLEYGDYIYGITMETPGVSKVVSLNLKKAKEIIEN